MPEEDRPDERPDRAAGWMPGEPRTVTDTLGLLSDETRVRIVLALEAAPEEGLRFSELRERSGVEDAGRFNYHLEQLRGNLVGKSGKTYRLTPTGEDVADLV